MCVVLLGHCRVLESTGDPDGTLSVRSRRLGDAGMESGPDEKDLGVLRDEKLDMTQQCESQL